MEPVSGATLDMLGKPAARSAFTVSRESFGSLRSIHANPALSLRWRCPFVLPHWLETWWRCFGDGDPTLLAVRRDDEVVGVAPLMVSGDTARIIGDPEVCDHFDIATAPGTTGAVWEVLCGHLKRKGVTGLDLVRVRPDSIAAAELVPAARRLGLPVDFTPQDVTLELELPGSWDDYLQGLSGKQRHELRRKLKRLREGAEYRLRAVVTAAEADAAVSVFLELFRLNRPEKALFMNARMEMYFRALAASLAACNQLRLFLLELDGATAAAAFCFQHEQTMYLYNNAYDNRFRSLSVGLLSKALSIRESITAGLRVYDFLRGAEGYKQHLGGRPAALHHCRIGLS